MRAVPSAVTPPRAGKVGRTCPEVVMVDLFRKCALTSRPLYVELGGRTDSEIGYGADDL